MDSWGWLRMGERGMWEMLEDVGDDLNGPLRASPAM